MTTLEMLKNLRKQVIKLLLTGTYPNTMRSHTDQILEEIEVCEEIIMSTLQEVICPSCNGKDSIACENPMCTEGYI